MTLTERAAYLKGLADGLKLDETKPESQILKEVISLLVKFSRRAPLMAPLSATSGLDHLVR